MRTAHRTYSAAPAAVVTCSPATILVLSECVCVHQATGNWSRVERKNKVTRRLGGRSTCCGSQWPTGSGQETAESGEQRAESRQETEHTTHKTEERAEKTEESKVNVLQCCVHTAQTITTTQFEFEHTDIATVCLHASERLEWLLSDRSSLASYLVPVRCQKDTNLPKEK